MRPTAAWNDCGKSSFVVEYETRLTSASIQDLAASGIGVSVYDLVLFCTVPTTGILHTHIIFFVFYSRPFDRGW